MNEAQYLRILNGLSVNTNHLATNDHHILTMASGQRVAGVYFNRNKHGVIHFTINPNSLAVIDQTLWERLPDDQIKVKDHGKPNVVPIPGREHQALRQLLESAGAL